MGVLERIALPTNIGDLVSTLVSFTSANGYFAGVRMEIRGCGRECPLVSMAGVRGTAIAGHLKRDPRLQSVCEHVADTYILMLLRKIGSGNEQPEDSLNAVRRPG